MENSPYGLNYKRRTPTPNLNSIDNSYTWRMKQFYETYRDDEKLAPLVRETGWTQNLIIMSRCKSNEEREFYLRVCAQNGYSKRELDRQISSGLYERTSQTGKLSPAVSELHPNAPAVFRDTYVRDVKKNHEKPSIGVLLCKDKDNEVVEYALSRSVSPTVISQYETKLIPRQLLRQKLHEFAQLAADQEGSNQ